MELGGKPDWQDGPGLVESMWRYRILLVVVAVNAAVLGYFLSAQQPKEYEARSRVFLSDPNASVFRDTIRYFADPTRMPRELRRLHSPEVTQRASELLDEEVSAEAIAGSLSADGDAEIEIMFITATARDPDRAAAIATATAQAYQQVVSEAAKSRAQGAIEELGDVRRNLEEQIASANEGLRGDPGDLTLQTQVDVAEQQLIALGGRAEQLAVDAALYGSGVERIEAAEVPGGPSAPNPKRDAAVGGMLGLMAAAAFAWWRAGRTQGADTSEAPASVLGAPLLGEIPSYKSGRGASIPLLTELDPVTAEAYQFVVASIGFALDGSSGKSAIITSAAPGDGKTATALNLAFASARDGRNVVLVDGDERVRGLSMRAGVANDRGLTDLGADGTSLEACSTTVALPGAGHKLQLIPAGKASVDPAGFFRTAQFRKGMAMIKESADFVLVDTPPILSVSDTSAIAGQVDGVILVVNRGTKLGRLKEVRDRLEFVGTPLIGYVFNRGSTRGKQAYYGYGDAARGGSGDGNGKAGWTASAPQAAAPELRRAR
ncbi:MAG TPA: AAA family ATPase [Egibacteraceae bacterium]|nr:AAA family ATPase [Egibacteraceae bacterium]